MKMLILIVAAILTLAAPTIAAEGDIDWKSTWDDAEKALKGTSKLVFLFFTNPGSRINDRIEAVLLGHAEVIDAISKHYVALKIDINDEKNDAILGSFRITRGPLMLIADSRKKVIIRPRFGKPEKFVEKLLKVAELCGLEKAVADKPKDPVAAYKLAGAYEFLGRLEESIDLLDNVCMLDADNSKGQKVHALFKLAKYRFGVREKDAAKKAADEVLKLDPEDKHGYKDDIAYMLAIQVPGRDDTESRIKNLEKFLADFPKSKFRADVLYYLGCYLYSMDRQEDKVNALKQLIREFPNSAYARQAKQQLEDIEMRKDKPKKPKRKIKKVTPTPIDK